MIVICVDSITRFQSCDLVEGQRYEVISTHGCREGCCYKLAKDGVNVWKKDRFIPLSNIDETELSNRKEESHVG